MKIFVCKKRKTIILIDNFGFKNRGDQLMIQSVYDQIKKYRPDAIVCLREDVFMQNPSYCIDRDIRPMAMHNAGLRHSSLYSRLVNMLLRKEWIITPKDIDVVFDCCGYYITDAWHKDESAYLYVKSYYDGFTKPNLKVIYLPQAFGPFRNEWSIRILEAAYSRATKIYAREPISYRYIESNVNDMSKVAIAPDFTCLLKGNETPSVQLPNKNYVVVIANSNMVEQTDSMIANNYMTFLKEVVTDLTDLGECVYLLNHEGDDDEQLLQELNASLIQPLPILTHLCGTDIKKIIAGAKLLITARYHGLVSGLSQGVPSLCTGWSHKYRELLMEYKCVENYLDVTDVQKSKQIIHEALRSPSKYSSKDGCTSYIESKVFDMWSEIYNEVL